MSSFRDSFTDHLHRQAFSRCPTLNLLASPAHPLLHSGDSGLHAEGLMRFCATEIDLHPLQMARGFEYLALLGPKVDPLPSSHDPNPSGKLAARLFDLCIARVYRVVIPQQEIPSEPQSAVLSVANACACCGLRVELCSHLCLLPHDMMAWHACEAADWHEPGPARGKECNLLSLPGLPC